jgi:hypothetical protein
VGENSLSPSCTHACASLFSFSSISLVVTIPSQHSNQVYSTNANILVTHLQEASSPVALLLVHIPSAPAQNPAAAAAAAAVGAAMVAAASAASHTLARKKAASSSLAAVLFPLLVPPLLALLLLLLLRLLRTQDSSSPSKRHKT